MENAIKLGFQHGAQNIMERSFTAPFQQPGLHTDSLKVFPISDELRREYGEPETKAVNPTEGRKFQKLDDIVHRVDRTLIIETSLGLFETQLVINPQLFT